MGGGILSGFFLGADDGGELALLIGEMGEEEGEVLEEGLLVAPLEEVGDLGDGLEHLGEVLHDLVALLADVRDAEGPHVPPRHHVQQRDVVHVREPRVVRQRQQHLRVLHLRPQPRRAHPPLLEVARHELEDVRRQRLRVDQVRLRHHVPRHWPHQLAELPDHQKVPRQRRLRPWVLLLLQRGRRRRRRQRPGGAHIRQRSAAPRRCQSLWLGHSTTPRVAWLFWQRIKRKRE